MSWRCHDCGRLLCECHVEPREPAPFDDGQLALFEVPDSRRVSPAPRDASRLEPRREAS